MGSLLLVARCPRPSAGALFMRGRHDGNLHTLPERMPRGAHAADAAGCRARHRPSGCREPLQRASEYRAEPGGFHAYGCNLRGRARGRGRGRDRRGPGRALCGLPPAAPRPRARHARCSIRRHVRRARRERDSGRRLAASMGVAADGDGERHPRAARVPGAAGGSCDGEPGRAAPVLRRVRAAIRARRAAARARAGGAPRRRRPRSIGRGSRRSRPIAASSPIAARGPLAT